MRVFVTGATGFIGSAVVQDLLSAGHQVLGLARNDEAADKLAKAGVEAHRGALSDPESLVAAARLCDGVAHLAFIHDFSQHAANVETDRVAVTALTDALAGSNKPITIASGTMMVAQGRPATEKDAPVSEGVPRAASEAIAVKAADRGVRGSVIRLSPTVHGAGDHGFVARLIEMARANGFAGYVGEGDNRWPAVHRLDAARLFRLALEKAEAGSRFHAVGEEGVPARSIAEAIGAGLGLPARSIAPDEAFARLGFLGSFFAIDNPTSSAVTRESLGWSPKEPGLLADMKAHYFS